MPLIAVLSNPNSNGNRRHLPRIRQFCAGRRDVMTVEVPSLAALRPALDRIADARPDVLVINGGDGTIQAVLTEIHADGASKRRLPPIAVLPGGRTNLIAKDMGATGDPVRALERVVAIAEAGVGNHLATRQLISLSTGPGQPPTLGMFLAAGALADVLLFCRHRLYSRGMPTWLAHLFALLGGIVSVLTNSSASFLPPLPRDSDLNVGGRRMRGRFQVVMVSTLQALILSGRVPTARPGALPLILLERRRIAALRSVWGALTGTLGRGSIPGLHLLSAHEISLAEGLNEVIMDGESFTAQPGEAIVLRPAPSVRFVDLRNRVRVSEPLADEIPGYAAARPEAAGVSRLSDAGAHSRHI